MTINEQHLYYISRLEGKTVQGVLEERIHVVKKILEIVSAVDKWDYRYAEDKWTIKQVVQHCIDCERIFSFRALHLVREDVSPLFGFDENAYAANASVDHKSGEAILYEYILLMESIRLMYEGFELKDLKKTGFIEKNEISVQDIGFIMGGHCLHHMDVLLDRYFK